jgi:hypothetical protein
MGQEMIEQIPLAKGSSVSFSGVWGNGAGGAANLTGYDISAYDCNPAIIAPQITMAMTNAAMGQFIGTIIWSDVFPDGRVATFKIRLTQASGFTLPPLAHNDPIYVEVT